MTTAGVVMALIATAAMLAWSTLMYAWVDHRQQRHRQRVITALAALRRRHDAEILELWVRVMGPGPYEPEGDWEPREIGELVDLEDDVFVPDPEPATAPIEMPLPEGPETLPSEVPLVLATVALDAEWEERRAQLDREWREAMDRIGGGRE